MRLVDRLARLEAEAASRPKEQSPLVQAIMADLCAEIDAYGHAKASTAVIYRTVDGTLAPINNPRAEYHFDPDGGSLLAQVSRYQGFAIAPLHVESREGEHAPF